MPQAYRFSYASFDQTWRAQVAALRLKGGGRQRDLVAGTRIVGDGADSSWDQLRRSILLTRELGNGGHVLWFSRGVLDLDADELTAFYRESGAAASPRFGAGWRQPSVALRREGTRAGWTAWRLPRTGGASYRLIGRTASGWEYLEARRGRVVRLPSRYTEVELILDRRAELSRARPR